MALTITPTQVQINDEGASVGNASIINFVGNAVTATQSANTATITNLAPTIGMSLMYIKSNYQL